MITLLPIGGYAEAPVEPPQEVKEEPTIEEYIVLKAEEYEVNPEMALAVANCESSLNPDAYGDSELGGSRGIWQIHAPSWPEVSDEVAYDPFLSTDWAMPKLKETPEIWTCYRMLSTGS